MTSKWHETGAIRKLSSRRIFLEGFRKIAFLTDPAKISSKIKTGRSSCNFSSMRATGRRVGRADVARIDEKLQEERPVLIFDHILAGSVKNAIFRNPSKKMRLDESFRMAEVSCHLEVVVKSYGQITKITSPHLIYPPLSYLNIPDPPLLRSVS